MLVDKKNERKCTRMEYVLKTDRLTKQFRSQKAVDNVSLHVAQGDIYGLIGKNGAGKTTLMRMLAGLASPTSGSYELFGEAGGRANRRVSALIENAGIYADLSALANLHAKCLALGVREEHTEERLLELVGLSDTGKKPVGKFSLGMKQRLGIALALVANPDLVILDEPINGLDPQGIADVRNIIEQLNRENGITFIISSHILGELSKFATRYGMIHQGQLLEELSREELFDKCSQKIIIQTPDAPAACPELENYGVTNYKVTDTDRLEIYERIDEVAEINRHLAIANIPISGIYVYNQELEDYFLNLTGGATHV